MGLNESVAALLRNPLPLPRRPEITEAMVQAWGARYDMQDSIGTLRLMIDDARSLHLLEKA